MQKHNTREFDFWYKMQKILMLLQDFLKYIIKIHDNFFRENTTHKRQLQKFFDKKKNILLTVYFVDCTNARNTWSIISHLSIPICQTFVGIFSCGVKNQNTGVSLMVVRWVHRLKFFLSSSVPKIFIKNI